MSDTSLPDLDESSDDETVPNTLGVQPYQYEPRREAADGEQSQHSSSEPSPDGSRVLNTEWYVCMHNYTCVASAN
ncbi:hypothetical protein MTO96_050570 [Rhipicephalus appendiculatus]